MVLLLFIVFSIREILESDREDDPVEELQQTVASILTKYNFDYKVKGNYVSKHNSRIRHRITDPHSVEQVLDNIIIFINVFF